MTILSLLLTLMLLQTYKAFIHDSSTHALLTRRGLHKHASRYSREHVSKTDTEEKKLLNKK